MNIHFEDFFINIDPEIRHIYYVMVLSPYPIGISDLLPIVGIQKTMTSKFVRDTLEEGRRRGFFRCNYYDSYLMDGNLQVWLYPLVKGYQREQAQLDSRKRNLLSYGYTNKSLIAYLDALWYQPDQVRSLEDALLYSTHQLSSMMTILDQPLYEEVYNRISPKIVEFIYRKKAEDVIHQLASCDGLYRLDEKFVGNKSFTLTNEQAHITYKTGNWEKAYQMLQAFDCSIHYYAAATLRFAEGDYPEALTLFEKGLKKQRRDYKQS